MNIINIELEKILEEAFIYKANNKNQDPIILISKETLHFIELQTKKNFYHNDIKEDTFPMIYGFYVAIANWLPFGEVELR